MPVYPQPNLDPNAAPWGRAVDQRLALLEQGADRKDKNDININKQQNSTAQVLAGQIAQLSSVVAQLTSVTNTLAAASNVQYGELGQIGNFSGFYGGARPTFLITSASGRIEIAYGGSIGGGSGYFVYSITNPATGATIVSRDTVLANAAARVAVTGGASFAPSGYKTAIINVPANTTVRVTLEFSVQDTFCTVFGSSLLVRGAL